MLVTGGSEDSSGFIPNISAAITWTDPAARSTIFAKWISTLPITYMFQLNSPIKVRNFAVSFTAEAAATLVSCSDDRAATVLSGSNRRSAVDHENHMIRDGAQMVTSKWGSFGSAVSR